MIHPSVRDVIGGTVKRITWHEILRHPVSRQILAAEGMAEFLTEKFASVIDLVFVLRHEVKKASKDVEARFEPDLHTILTIHFK